jgi:hypothetical protein
VIYDKQESQELKMGKTKTRIQKKRPKDAIRKGLLNLSQPLSKRATSCSPMPSATYSTLVFRNRPGQSEPILIGGANMLKPALRLTNLYRLRIEEIKGTEVVTSYTRWMDCVQAFFGFLFLGQRGSFLNRPCRTILKSGLERTWGS